jgi:hypothetical protein
MEGGRQWLDFGLSREREQGGAGYSSTACRRGRGGLGMGGTWSGSHCGRPDSGERGRLPATCNMEVRGRGGVVGMWAGSGVGSSRWEREKRERG